MEKIINDIKKIVIVAKKDIDKVENFEELKLVKSKYLSKNPIISKYMLNLKSTSDLKKKKEIGNLLNNYRVEISSFINSKLEEIEIERINKNLKKPIINSTAKFNSFKVGNKHPLRVIEKEIIDFFKSRGYQVVDAPMVESAKYNFDNLNLDKYHPARIMHDTFYLKNGKLLRTHATNSTSRVIERMKEDNAKVISIGKVYRNDEDDATHYHQFHQIDVLDIGEDANISKLFILLRNFTKHFFGPNSEINFRTSYFPFTEPSFEVDVKSEKLSKNGWVEILGCGILNKKVIEKSGKDSSKVSGFAIGIGLERLAMLKWKVDDIRNFYNSDLEFLNIMNGEK